MNKQKGFTVVEFIIAGAIVMILLTLILGGMKDNSQCLGGYLWVSDINGTLHQVIGENGLPVACRR